MPDFEELPERDLDRLTDAELIAYVVAAREAGAAAAERTAVGVLAFAFEPTIKAWVRKDMGSAPEDVDDVVMEVLQSAIRSTFEGKVVGEFGAFLRTIAARRVVDYFRKRGRSPQTNPLASEHEGDEDVWGPEPASADEAGAIAVREVVARLLVRRNVLHQKVIRLYGPNVLGFMDLSAEEVRARIDGDGSGETVSADNVAQIWSRFKRDLKAELDG